MQNEPLVMTIDGKEYKFSFPGYQVHLEAEDEIRKLRRNECLKMVQEYSEAAEEGNLESLRLSILSMFDNVLRDVVVQFSEIIQWQNRPSGDSFNLWKSMLIHQPEMNQKEALGVYSEMTNEQRLQVGSLGEPEEEKVD